MTRIQARCEEALADCLPEKNETPALLHEAMRYAALDGGKRVRPLLVFAAGVVSGAAEKDLAVAASAVELIHAYSLVHDDLPSMDDDVLRRGRPTCHVRYGEAMAILIGDSLQTLAFQVLAEAAGFSAARKVEMIALLAWASGSRGMAGGQAIDLTSAERRLERGALEEMHQKKTGALIRAAVAFGRLCGKVDSAAQACLDQFARQIGLLFQVVDDVLDASAESTVLGKTAGKDALAHKSTYVSLMGLDAARRYADDLRRDARAALLPLGDRASRLHQLTDYIVTRSF